MPGIFSSFQNDSINFFENTGEENCFLILQIMLLIHVHMFIISRDIEIRYVFYSKAYFHLSNNFYTVCLRAFNLNLSTSFRVVSRSPLTFKTKLSVTTINESFQLLPIFCHKELLFRCCIGLVLNIVAWYMKHLKDMRKHLQWSSTTLVKYEKLHFQRFFALD